MTASFVELLSSRHRPPHLPTFPAHKSLLNAFENCLSLSDEDRSRIDVITTIKGGGAALTRRRSAGIGGRHRRTNVEPVAQPVAAVGIAVARVAVEQVEVLVAGTAGETRS